MTKKYQLSLTRITVYNDSNLILKRIPTNFRMAFVNPNYTHFTHMWQTVCKVDKLVRNLFGNLGSSEHKLWAPLFATSTHLSIVLLRTAPFDFHAHKALHNVTTLPMCDNTSFYGLKYPPTTTPFRVPLVQGLGRMDVSKPLFFPWAPRLASPRNARW